jgi:hypothetical protein
MNTLIEKLMETGIQTSPFENYADEQKCLAIAYCNTHFNASPYGELGLLIAQQAMDEGRTRVSFEAPALTLDEANFQDAADRGRAEVEAFMGFDIDLQDQAIHATFAGTVYATATGKKMNGLFWKPGCRKERWSKLAEGLKGAILRHRQGLVQSGYGRPGLEIAA